MLYDNSAHFIKELTLQYQSYNLNWTCLGEGLVTGSPEFCKINQCHENGTKLGFLKRNELVRYFNQDGSVLIRAWGYAQLKYYSFKSDSKSFAWNSTTLSCELGGVRISFPKGPANIFACSLPYCYQIHRPTNNFSVSFPREILIKDYDYYLDIYDDGKLVNHMLVHVNLKFIVK